MRSSGKLVWYWRRLRAMGPAEIGHRIAEKWRKQREPSAFAAFAPGPQGGGAGVPALPDPNTATGGLRAAVMEDAANILAGRWTLLHGQVLNVDTPPRWHRDYMAGVEMDASARRAAALDHRRMPGGMDARLVWELSRWTQLVRLAQAYFLTRDERWSRAVESWLRDWQQHNPAGYGWNWTSPMEPGLRLINLTWIDALCPLPDDLVHALLPPHVWWVWRYRSFGSSANNHLLGELCGLICACARWPAAEKWSASLTNLGAQVQDEILRQFGEDGGNLEQALHYHLFAWEMGWQAVRTLQSRGVPVRTEVIERLARAGAFFAHVASPAEPWDFGDSDDAHITPVYQNEEHAIREWQAWFTGETNALTYWWGSAPEPREWTGPRHYRIVHRDGWMLRHDVSPLGFGRLAAHGHLDALHCSLWLDGKAVMIDPGTGSYFAAPEKRALLAGRTSHNGPHLLDETLYPQRHGSFLWSGPHSVPEVADSVSAVFFFEHVLTRRIDEAAGGWSFTDKCVAPFAVRWLIAPEWVVTGKDGHFNLTREDMALTLDVTGAPAALDTGVCSPAYGKIGTCPVITIRAERGGQIVTVIARQRAL